MPQKVVLLDLENNPPNIKLLRDIIEHYPVLYVFNCSGQFEFALQDLTEFSAWVTSGQIMVLDTPTSPHKEFEYAVVVGQLLALLEHPAHVELISAMDSGDMLMKMLEASNISCSLILIEPEQNGDATHSVKSPLPSVEAIKSKPNLLLVKKYCDALAHMSGKPTTIDSLKNSVANILQQTAEEVQHLVGMLINLRLVKSQDNQIHFRKKVLKQWIALDLNAEPKAHSPLLEQVISELKDKSNQKDEESETIQSVQSDLFKNFARIDPVQLEVARKLRELKSDKPKDIYQLRDLLEQLFPESDIRLLLKELIEKGYIYWNGHEVLYSHEMFLN